MSATERPSTFESTRSRGFQKARDLMESPDPVAAAPQALTAPSGPARVLKAAVSSSHLDQVRSLLLQPPLTRSRGYELGSTNNR